MYFRYAIVVISLLMTAVCGTAQADEVSRVVGKAVYRGNSDLSSAFANYLNRLRPRILNNWNYPDGKNHVTLQAIISNDGTVSDTNLVSTPANPIAEQAASVAFAQAQPLEPLPSRGILRARLTLIFDSTADPHGDSNSNLLTRLDPVVSDNSK